MTLRLIGKWGTVAMPENSRIMVKKTTIIPLALFIVFLSSLSLATDIEGIINVNTTWSFENSPYTLTDTVQIADNITLTIEPGVAVNGQGHSIGVWGTLNAIGTNVSHIIFNDVDIDPGNNTSSDAFLINIQFSEIYGGSMYRPTGSAVYGSLTLKDSIVEGTSYIYLWYPVNDCYIERNIFSNAGGISVGTRIANVSIRNNVFYQQTTDYAIKNWRT